jgi:hypothetical protein
MSDVLYGFSSLYRESKPPDIKLEDGIWKERQPNGFYRKRFPRRDSVLDEVMIRRVTARQQLRHQAHLRRLELVWKSAAALLIGVPLAIAAISAVWRFSAWAIAS